MSTTKPAVPEKPPHIHAGKKPPVKKKPMIKSQSVDLTQVGDSEWKDFVLKRKQEKEENDPEEKERFHTVLGLKEHRNSLFDQTIAEDQVLNLTKLSQIGTNGVDQVDDNVMPMTQTETESEQSVTSEPVRMPVEPNTKVDDLANNSQHEATKVNETCPPAVEQKELKTENDIIITPPPNEVSNAAPLSPRILAKPRNIGSELKRHEFSRNRAMSLPVANSLLPSNTSFLRRSSDMLKDLKTESHTSQTPYFLRHSRGSVDLQDISEIANLNVNAETADDSAFDTEPPDLKVPYFCRTSRGSRGSIDLQDTLTSISNLNAKEATADNGTSGIEPAGTEG